MVRFEWLGRARARAMLYSSLIAVGLIAVMNRGPRWLGSWKLALDVGAGSVTLLGPVAAAISCGVYVRVRRSNVEDLLPQSGRPWRAWTAPALGVWTLATVAVLTLTLLMTAGAWFEGAAAHPELWWILPPTLLVLGAQVAIGTLVGSLIPHYWAVPWVTVGVFGFFILTRVDVIPVVFDTGPTSGSLIGNTFAPPWFAFQAVVAAGLIGAALAGAHPALFRSATPLAKLLTGATVAAAAFTLVAVPAPADRYGLVTEVDWVCRDGHPQVCLPEDGHRPLNDVAERIQRLAATLTDAGVQVPDKFIALVPGQPLTPGVGEVSFPGDEDLAREVSDATAAQALAVPARCPEYSMDIPPIDPAVWLSAQRYLARWILVQGGAEEPPTEGFSRLDWWQRPTEQQYPWIRSTYAALSECRLRDLTLPPEDEP